MSTTSTRRSSAANGQRLSADDWIQAGFATIAEEGLKALKIDRLCERLGVTKGSFYWHFADIDSYRDALAEAWGDHRDADRRAFAELDELEPRERLRRMMGSLTSPRQWALERAVREWARTDPKVAASVRASDRWIYEAVRKAFRDYGFPPDEADFRARASWAVGVGFIHTSGPRPSAKAIRDRERFIDFMLRD
jgi:AcrR family transcriptional regulator